MKPHDAVPLEFVHYGPDEMIERARRFEREMKRRRSIRCFSDAPVPREVIERAIATAGSAPSGANHQPWHFAVISDPEKKACVRLRAEAEERSFYARRAGEEWLSALRPLGTDADKAFLEFAPYLIAVFAQKRGGATMEAQRKNYYVNESVGIACGFLIAALHQAGLATLTHTPNPMGFLNEVCGRPKTEKAYLLLVAGLPCEGATIPVHATKKKQLRDIASFF